MAKTIAKLKGGELSLTGAVNERMPNLQKRMKVRYIRGGTNGSTANNANHLVEIQAFNQYDVNVALGKTVIKKDGSAANALVTDGSSTSNPYEGVNGGYTLDLGTAQYIDYVKVWHYWADSRRYYESFLEVSEDGVTYHRVFDSKVDGEYAETSAGKLHIIPPFGLVEHYPFDGTTMGYRELYHSRIAYVCREDTKTDWYAWFSKRCKNFTFLTVAQFNALTPEQAQAYDLVYYDCRNYEVPASVILKLKTFVDAGVSCIARGNDVTESHFVGSIRFVNDAERTVDVLDTVPFGFENSTFTATTDPNRFIIDLKNGAEPLTIRRGTDLITGFMYIGPSGAVLIFDGEGYTYTPIPDYFIASFKYALEKSTSKVLLSKNDVVSYKGLMVDAAATNLVTSTHVYNNFKADIKITALDETYNGHQVYRWAYTPTTEAHVNNINKALGGQGFYSNNITFKANTKYSASVIWRPVNKADIEVGGLATNIYNWYYGHQKEDLGDGWYRFNSYRDGAATADGTDARHMSVRCKSLKLNETLYVDFCCFQITEGNIFPSSYTKTSRAAQGALIPFNLKAPFTISMKYRSAAMQSTVKDQQSSPKILQLSDYYTNASLTLWNYHSVGGIVLYVKADTGSAWSGYKALKALTTDEWDNKDNVFALVAHSDTLFEVFMNGESLGTVPIASPATLFSSILFEPVYNTSAAVKDLSIYDKALNHDEIKKLHSSAMNFDEDGTLYVRGIDESVPHIPEGSLYFPLSTDVKDTKGLVSALQSTGRFQDGAAWAGGTAYNVYTNPTFDDGARVGWKYWGSEGYKATVSLNTDRENIYSPDSNASVFIECFADSPHPYLIYQLPEFSGGYRSMQAIICMNDGSPVTQDKVSPNWNAHNGGLSKGVWSEIKRIGTSKWYLCKAEGFSQDGSDDVVGLRVHPGSAIYVDFMTLEHTPYCSPLKGHGTPGSMIRFNLTRDYQMKWNEDWSIVYWRLPKGTSIATDYGGYAIDSLGVYQNTANPGYAWWGKNYGSDWYTRPTHQVNDKYFKEWHMVAIVSVGGIITFYSAHSNGWYSELWTVQATTPDYFMGHNGYDLSLGGHVNTLNAAYFRDLIITKKAFTEDELKNLYKTNMALEKNKLTLRTGIIESI